MLLVIRYHFFNYYRAITDWIRYVGQSRSMSFDTDSNKVVFPRPYRLKLAKVLDTDIKSVD